MAKRDCYEAEVFCNDCAVPTVHYTGAKAGRLERAMTAWARRHNAGTGHETITRLSYVYERAAAGARGSAGG